MVFQQMEDTSARTKQLYLNNTHIEPATQRKNVSYENGVPEKIIFHSMNDKGQSVIVEMGPITVIGRKRSMRDYEVNVDLTDLNAGALGVSHYHAMMLAFDNHIYIKDINSMNGMLLNGKRMQPSREYIIMDRDIIALGNLELKIEFVYT